MQSDSVVVPDTERQAWPGHIQEVLFCLIKSNRKAPLVFAEKVALLFYQFYGCYLAALGSQEQASWSDRVGSEDTVEDAVCSPVRKVEGQRITVAW